MKELSGILPFVKSMTEVKQNRFYISNIASQGAKYHPNLSITGIAIVCIMHGAILSSFSFLVQHLDDLF